MRPFLSLLALLAAVQTSAAAPEDVDLPPQEIAVSTQPAKLPALWEHPAPEISSSSAVSNAVSGDDKPAPDETEKARKDLMDSIGGLKGKVPDALYLQMEAQAKQAADEMAAHPDEPATEVLRKVTGVDFDRLARRSAELKKQNPKMTDDEVSRIIGAELIKSLPKLDPAPASKP